MSLSTKLFLIVAATGIAGFANTITFNGPSGTIIGDPLEFDIFKVQITQPTVSDPNWILQIQTNYGATIPGSSDVIPAYKYGNGISYGMGDFLITWNGNDYGIVMTPHDGYSAGDLYEASGFQTSGQVMGYSVSPRGSHPVLLDAGGSLLGIGFLSGAKTGNGTTTALYTITDEFKAPPNFLTGQFNIDVSSYVCANGFITGQPPVVPEPGTFLLMAPALLLLGRRLMR